MLHSVSSRHLGKGGKMVHAINGGGGEGMCHVGVRSAAAATGVRGHAPRENFKNGFSETHSGAFSAQYNDGQIVHQNPPSQQLHI